MRRGPLYLHRASRHIDYQLRCSHLEGLSHDFDSQDLRKLTVAPAIHCQSTLSRFESENTLRRDGSYIESRLIGFYKFCVRIFILSIPVHFIRCISILGPVETDLAPRF